MVSLLEGYSGSVGAMMPSGVSPEFPITVTAAGVVVIAPICPDFFGIGALPHSTITVEPGAPWKGKLT